MDEETEGYKKLIEGKKLNPKRKELFEKTLKKATKQHGSK